MVGQKYRSPSGEQRNDLYDALAEVAAVAADWCMLMQGATGDAERTGRLNRLTPRCMQTIMNVALDALEADGVDSAEAVDAAVERIRWQR